MKEIDFFKHLLQAINICDDYSTESPDSDVIDMLWFTPAQLKQYTEYCIEQRKPRKTNPNKRKKDALQKTT